MRGLVDGAGYPSQTLISREPGTGALYVKDNEAFSMAQELAKRRGLTKTDAVKLALRHELERDEPVDRRPLCERMIAFWERYPLPETLGPVPDQAFFDELSGDL